MGHKEDLERVRRKYADFLAMPDEPRTTRPTRPLRRVSTPISPQKSPGMAIERNKEGILYFRQSLGEHQACVTWHIDPPGEAHLGKRGIKEGDRLTHPMFRELEQRGWLYKLNARPSPRKLDTSRTSKRSPGNQASALDKPQVKKIVETTPSGQQQTVWIVSKPTPSNQTDRKKR